MVPSVGAAQATAKLRRTGRKPKITENAAKCLWHLLGARRVSRARSTLRTMLHANCQAHGAS